MPDKIKKKMSDAPNYGPAKNMDTTCGNCVHGGDGYCDLYHGNYKSGYWCSSWEPMTKQYDKHTPPSEVMHNAQRGQSIYNNLPLEHRSMDTTKYEIMSGLAVGRPMGKDELDAVDAHHQEFSQHPDKHMHLGMGGRAGRSWVKRLKRMYAAEVTKYDPDEPRDERGRWGGGGGGSSRNPQGERPKFKGTIVAPDLGRSMMPAQTETHGVATTHGYEKTGQSKGTGRLDYSHTSGASLEVYRGGDWAHTSPTGETVVGENAKELSTHLVGKTFESPHRVNGYTYPVDQAAGSTSKRFDIELQGTITKVNADQKRVWGWASVIQKPIGKPVVDNQGDVITPEELQSMAWTYLDDCRTAGVMHERTKGVGYLIDSIVFTADIQKALDIDLGQVGWFIGFQIQDDKVWDRVRRGELKSFSIHGTGKRTPVSEDDLGKLV